MKPLLVSIAFFPFIFSSLQAGEQDVFAKSAARLEDRNLADATLHLIHYPRPWTVPTLIRWFDAATDDLERARLIWPLALSQDSRAALVLIGSLKLESLLVRDSAYLALHNYFLSVPAADRSPQTVRSAVDEWVAANRKKLEREASVLPPLL